MINGVIQSIFKKIIDNINDTSYNYKNVLDTVNLIKEYQKNYYLRNIRLILLSKMLLPIFICL